METDIGGQRLQGKIRAGRDEVLLLREGYNRVVLSWSYFWVPNVFRQYQASTRTVKVKHTTLQMAKNAPLYCDRDLPAP